LKIAIIRQRFNPHGGAERFVSRALAALAKRQLVTLHLVARSWEPIQNIHFHRCDPWYLGRLTRDLGFAYFACLTAKTLNVDLIQSHERMWCCDIYRAGDGVHREWVEQKKRRLSWFKSWAMSLNPYHLYIQYAERRMFENERLKAVICNSHMVKSEILRHFRIDETKIHVIYNGVDTAVFHPGLKQERQFWRKKWGLPDAATVFLFVGSGFDRKGLQQAIDALALLQQETYLVVAGYDKHEKFYHTGAVKRGLQERVLFLGSQSDVKPFFALADAFVLPTLYDPFSNAVLEAMACGLPVITSNKAGASELLTDGDSGFICDAHDTLQISTAMRLLCNRERAEKMGNNARTVAEQYDWSVMGEALENLYQSLLGAK